MARDKQQGLAGFLLVIVGVVGKSAADKMGIEDADWLLPPAIGCM